MRTLSCKNSIENLEITQLAIAETVICMSFSVAFAVDHKIFLPLGIAILVAPLLLLRTNRSVHLGLQITKIIFNPERFRTRGHTSLHYRDFEFPNYFLLALPLITIIVPIMFLAIRVTALTATVILHPIESMRSIPTNWKRIVLCTDLHYPPEFIPNIDDVKELAFLRYDNFFYYSTHADMINWFKSHDTIKDYFLAFAGGLSAGLFLFSLLSSYTSHPSCIDSP